MVFSLFMKKRAGVLMKLISHIFVSCLVIGMAIFSSIFINSNTTYQGYELLYILPLLYMVLFILILSPLLFYRFNTFLMSYTLVTFLRYLILPFLIVKSGWYIGRSPVDPMASSFSTALLLMMWELILTTAAIAFFFSRKKILRIKPFVKTSVELPQSIFIYVVYILMSFVVLAAVPEALNSFAFLMPRDNMIDIGMGGFKISIVQFILITAKYLIFLLMMMLLYRRYERTKGTIWIWLSFGAVLLNIMIIFGDNRSDFLISAIASLYLFYRLFLKRSLPFIFSTVVLVFIVFMNITTYRNTTSITGGENRLTDLTDMLQIYAGGPYNVAMAIELPSYFPNAATIGNFIYDLGRPIIGLNVFFRELQGFEFSNYLYNYRIYFSDHVSQIIPIVGQGNLYMGFLFAPLLNVTFVALAYILYKIMCRQNQIELIFFLTIPITRIGFMMGQNAGILLNDISFILVLNITLYLLNHYVVLRRKGLVT